METMKSMFFACALLLGSAETFSAENLVLSEDFESQTFPPSGWVVKGTELSEDLESGYAHWSLNWNEVTGCSIAGSGCAEVMSDFKEGQAGISKEEWLITPAVQVADNASLSFTFWCNASSFMTNKYGSFLVKVSTDDGDTWSDLWNAASQEDIENSGLTWPWNKDAMGIENNWQKLTPNVSLEAYVGKTVKIAFYFRSILVNNYTQATLAVDNVKVGNQEIENLPVVEGSTSYEFSNSYIGYLAQSEPMTIRNVGYGTLTITSIEGIEGTDFSTTLDPASVSPRLDLSAGNGKVKFDYIETTGEEYIDDSFLPSTYFILYYKKNTDTDWTELWCSLDDSKYNEWVQKEIEIKDANGNFVVDDNVYLRWTYEFEMGDGGLDNMVVTDIYFDNVVLPKLYGEGELPLAITTPNPVNGVSNVDYSRLTLSWEPALFADGYELSVGTDKSNPTSLLENEKLEGNTSVSYTIPELEPATTYYWKVVPYNAVGKNENASVWSFTTMEDQSVRDFPYTMGFEGNNGEIPPMGWKNDHEGKGIQMWKSNEIEPFAGKYSASVWHNNAGEVSVLTSPVFAIPETGDIVASFAWGGALCNRLEKGYENEAITEGPISEVNDADGTLYFEIRAVDAADWTPLAYTQDRTKWRHKYVSLADYAGKSVNMRWRFVATENAGVSSGGASLDEIFVGDIKDMPTLAVSEIKKENLTVYPNPTSDYVYWAGGKADVKVYDLAGNCIKDLTEVESVSLEGLASGMYIVSVSCGDSVSTARVMKR